MLGSHTSNGHEYQGVANRKRELHSLSNSADNISVLGTQG